MHNVKNNRTARKFRQIANYSKEFQYPSLNNDQTDKTDRKSIQIWQNLKKHFQPICHDWDTRPHQN